MINIEMTKDVDKIRQVSINLKDALYKADINELSIGFQQFPKGSCGDVSLILAHILQKQGFNNIKYICAYRGSQSHAWLEYGSIFIDITIQQFDKNITDVIFTPDNPIYNKFKINKSESYIINSPLDLELLNDLVYLESIMVG